MFVIKSTVNRQSDIQHEKNPVESDTLSQDMLTTLIGVEDSFY